jgi:hypothetical protein
MNSNLYSYIAVQIAVLLGFVLLPSRLLAEQNSGIGPQSVQLNFAVNVPQLLLLRIGSGGATVDTVRFDPPVVPKNNWVNASSGGTQTVMISGIVPPTTSIRLTADSSLPLSVGGETIPFNQIRASGAGFFSSVSNLAFTGTTNQLIWSTTGAGMRQGSFQYQYYNAASTPSGFYSGTVTYTLATP